jgi:hypothetical protein
MAEQVLAPKWPSGFLRLLAHLPKAGSINVTVPGVSEEMRIEGKKIAKVG